MESNNTKIREKGVEVITEIQQPTLPLLYLALLSLRSGKVTSQIYLISGCRNTLAICMCKRTRDLLLWILTWTSMCLLGILLGTRSRSSIILLSEIWLFQRGQILMRGIILVSRELIVLHHNCYLHLCHNWTAHP